MGNYYLPLILLLILLAIIVQDSFVFTLIYLFAGAYGMSRWWSRRALAAVTFEREFTKRAFPEEEVSVSLRFTNKGWLPVIWLLATESLPVGLTGSEIFRRVFNLGPYGRASYEYFLRTKKRGYYRVGPLFIRSGDVLGLVVDVTREGDPDFLIVYPRIVQLTNIPLPSRSPHGQLRHTLPIFEDPTRIISKRDYVAGDSMRRIDWKTTAVTNHLVVKQFEPSIALEVSVFLNLNQDEYRHRQRFEAEELAVIIAASISSWLVSKKQPVGLVSNGLDPLYDSKMLQPLSPKNGQGHLMRILENLARVRMGRTIPFAQLLQKERIHLPWGSTIVLITGNGDEDLFDELFQCNRQGLNTALVLCGQVAGVKDIRARARYFKIPFYYFQRERDLDVWR